MSTEGNDAVTGGDVHGDEVSKRKAGRKPEGESRKNELCAALVRWKEMPESSRPSLRALANVTHAAPALPRHAR